MRARQALAASSGLLYFLAFPGVGAWPLAFIAFTPLLIALDGSPPRQAALLGWIAGFLMTLLGFYWMQGMLENFSGFPSPVCFLIHALLAGYQAGRISLFAWLYARATERGFWPGLVFALAFIASEQLYPLLFTWYFGATVHGLPRFVQIAELGNPIAVGLALLPTSWVAFEIFRARRARRRVRTSLVVALLSLPVLVIVYGSVRIPQVEALVAGAPKVRVGVVQANMSLSGKRSDREEGLRRHLKLTRELAEQGPVDLAVWSETSVAGVVDELAASSYYQATITRQLGIPTIFGAVLSRPVSDARRHTLFNAALLSDRQGRIVGRYDKHYLLPFGEYLPFGDSFPKLYEYSPNTGHFTAGSSAEPLRLGDYRISVDICYEDIIPGFINESLRGKEVDLLVNMTNDAWYGDTTEPWIHLALAKFRAIEHRRFLVRSTNSGVSAVIDPVGRVVAQTATFREQAIAAEVAMLRPPRTVYERLGDWPWWLASFAACGLAFWPVRRRTVTPDSAIS